MKGATIKKTISAAASNIGTYKWKIPGTLATGNKYKIKIILNTTPMPFDLSNKVFTIY